MKRFTSRCITNSIRENPRESGGDCLLDYFKKEAVRSSNVNQNQVWCHYNIPTELWSKLSDSKKNDYIHDNPVEEGVVFRPEKYKYSSALEYAGEKGLLDGVVVFVIF